MFANVFEPTPGHIYVVISDKGKKVQEKEFKTPAEAINWLADDCLHIIDHIKTDWYKNR